MKMIGGFGSDFFSLHHFRILLINTDTDLVHKNAEHAKILNFTKKKHYTYTHTLTIIIIIIKHKK